MGPLFVLMVACLRCGQTHGSAPYKPYRHHTTAIGSILQGLSLYLSVFSVLSIQDRLDSSGRADLRIRCKAFSKCLTSPHLRPLADSETLCDDGAIDRSLLIFYSIPKLIFGYKCRSLFQFEGYKYRYLNLLVSTNIVYHL